MAVEQLHSEDRSFAYHGYQAAHHLVRYSSVKNFVKGKRVLDIACGEGYGCKLLKSWGAKHVVGVDISADAIAIAKRTFSSSSVDFEVGGADRIVALSETYPIFDVIVSFESIELLQSPERFLDAICKLRRKKTIIAISCPNEEPFYGEDRPNEVHLQRFSFPEFSELCESKLGETSSWFIGAALLGECNVPVDFKIATIPQKSWLSIAEPSCAGEVLQVASSPGVELAHQNCSHFLGIWGAKTDGNAVFSAQSIASMPKPWRAIGELKGLARDNKQSTDGTRI